MNTIEKFIKQKKPFCIVCTNSNLGNTRFIVYLDGENKQGTKDMTKEDVVALRQGITKQLYNRIDLDVKGTIYELKERPFKAYCEQVENKQRGRRQLQAA